MHNVLACTGSVTICKIEGTPRVMGLYCREKRYHPCSSTRLIWKAHGINFFPSPLALLSGLLIFESTSTQLPEAPESGG